MTPDDLSKLKQFVINSTSSFDESHDANHAFQVYEAAIDIANSLDIPYEEDMITYISMCHDIRDHKYPNSISEDELRTFLTEHLGRINAMRALGVIHCISWSGESKGNYPRSSVIWDSINSQLLDYVYLVIVRDADRLQALGPKGIDRCLALCKARGLTDSEAKEETHRHCKEKLLRLLPERYIVSDRARLLAKEGHDYIRNWYYSNGAWLAGR